MQGRQLAEWIGAFVSGMVRDSPENSTRDGSGEPAFDAPLIGFARGDDPLFQDYKRHVGPFHWTPAEALALAFPEERLDPAQVSVVSWVLPQTEATKRENAAQKVYCSERWARVRLYGEAFNAQLRRGLAQALVEQGVPAAAPMLLPQWTYAESPDYGKASTWSERHAAHACGLGTFGLCDGLITPLGKAMRLGSVVLKGSLPVAPRPYGDHHAYCLFYSHGTCGQCIGRCPVKALSPQGHDKKKCERHVAKMGKEHNQEAYGLDIEGCGLCQVDVPCSSGIPAPDAGA